MIPVSAAGPVIHAEDWKQLRLWVTWMTCAYDGLEHAISDEAFALAYDQGIGAYHAVCGHLVVPQALISPPGRRCGECLAVLHERLSWTRRNGWFGRLLGRLGLRCWSE